MTQTTTFLPTKVRLRRCTLDGVDARPDVSSIKVYESCCTPYIKAEITWVDNRGALEQIAHDRGSLAGLKMYFAMDAGENVYEQELVIMSADAQPPENVRMAKIYNITLIGQSFIKERQSLVQKSFVNISATQVAATIHNQFLGGDAPLRVLQNAIGFIAKSDIGSYPVSNDRPFKAIINALRTGTYGQVAANPTMYFRDATSYVLAPLQTLFRSAAPQVRVTESATLGKSIDDIFITGHNSIISAALLVEEGDLKGSRSKVSSKASAAHQSLNILDHAAGEIINRAVRSTSVSNIFNGLTGTTIGNAVGGSMNILGLNTLRRDKNHSPEINRIQEGEFLASVADSNKYMIKYPIRPGFQTTVGKAIEANILVPGVSGRYVGGLMLVTELMHECYFDDRIVQGTTTVKCIRTKDVV